MHRADHATRAQDLHGAGLDGYTEGNPSLGVPATVVTSDALNAFQEEIANAIEGRGIALDKGDNTQLYQALGAPLAGVREMVRPELATVRGAFAWAGRAAPVWDSGAGRPEWVTPETSGGALEHARVCHSSTGRLVWSFGPGCGLPFQCTVHLVRVFLQQASAHAEGNRATVQVRRMEDDFSTTVVATAEAAAGTALQAVTLSGLNVPIVGTFTDVWAAGPAMGLTVTVRGGAASAPVGDLAYLCEVRYTAVVL